jgi:hypothetical protein
MPQIGLPRGGPTHDMFEKQIVSNATTLLHHIHFARSTNAQPAGNFCIWGGKIGVVEDIRNMLASLPPSSKILFIFGTTILPSMGRC